MRRPSRALRGSIVLLALAAVVPTEASASPSVVERADARVDVLPIPEPIPVDPVSPPEGGAPPAFTERPTLEAFGRPRLALGPYWAELLYVLGGAWTGAGEDALAQRWFRCRPGTRSCRLVQAGADNGSIHAGYEAKLADIGWQIEVRLRVQNPYGTAEVTLRSPTVKRRPPASVSAATQYLERYVRGTRIGGPPTIYYPRWLPPTVRGTLADLEFPSGRQYRVDATGRRASRHGPTFLWWGSMSERLGSVRRRCDRITPTYRRVRYGRRALATCWSSVYRIVYWRHGGRTYFVGSKYYGVLSDRDLLRVAASMQRVR